MGQHSAASKWAQTERAAISAICAETAACESVKLAKCAIVRTEDWFSSPRSS